MKQSEIVDYLIEGEWDDENEVIATDKFKVALFSLDSAQAIHDFATSYNFDCGLSELHLVLDHPKLDRATALAIYWMLAPGYFLQYQNRNEINGHEKEHFETILAVHSYLNTTQKVKGSIQFNPFDDNGLDWTKEYEKEMRLLPQKGKRSFYEIPKDFYS